MIGLPCALGKILDLVIFHGDFRAEKFYFVVLFLDTFLQLTEEFCRAVSLVVGARCRGLSRLVGGFVFWSLYCRALSRLVATGRGRSRHVGACRDRSHLL